ncbi:hypothetical protein [uncultured Lactobacillus sp.]|uniref:hypothetical protein n=1 Tax=uncultured Lactobacillus sp. TaxID=153152 RepID=UPI0025F98EF7|nr:hypothetical protein [uncultured Lactobacillus sp.]
MAGETTNNTENTEKSWQDVANDLKQRIDKNSLWVQVGYISNDKVDCEPILLSQAHTENFWPVIVEEPPVNLVHPKYDYPKHRWVELEAESNSSRLTDVENSVKSLKQSDEQVTKDNNDIKNSLSGIAKGQAEMLKILGSATSPKAPTTTDSKQDGGSTND